MSFNNNVANVLVWPNTRLRWDYSLHQHVYLQICGTTIPPHSKPKWEQCVVSVSDSSFKPPNIGPTDRFVLSSIPDYPDCVKVYTTSCYVYRPLRLVTPSFMMSIPTISASELALTDTTRMALWQVPPELPDSITVNPTANGSSLLPIQHSHATSNISLSAVSLTSKEASNVQSTKATTNSKSRARLSASSAHTKKRTKITDSSPTTLTQDKSTTEEDILSDGVALTQELFLSSTPFLWILGQDSLPLQYSYPQRELIQYLQRDNRCDTLPLDPKLVQVENFCQLCKAPIVLAMFDFAGVSITLWLPYTLFYSNKQWMYAVTDWIAKNKTMLAKVQAAYSPSVTHTHTPTT